ncbi:Phosphotransferase [Savitreella phatthalungensis]
MYLSRQNLENLRLYKYSSIDKSPVSKYILKPYWSWLVTLFPRSMAPNLITLSGLGFVVFNVAQLLYYAPALDRPCPPWVYLCWAISLWLYQSFDSIDGMQARRTGQSSPLGEMFDHGCDALNTTLEVLLTCSSINLGKSWWALISQFATVANFYLTTWEEYHTGTLYLSFFSGPVEGILIVIGLHTTAWLYGPAFWDTPFWSFLGLAAPSWAPFWITGMQLKHAFLYFGAVGLMANIVSASVNVGRARRKQNLPLGPALAGLVPFFTTAIITLAFAYQHEKVVVTELVIPYMLVCGIVAAYQVGLVITAHVTHAPFPVLPPLALLLPMIIALLVPPPKWSTANERAFVWSMLGLVTGVYGSFVIDVITDITTYLDIWCLTIKHPQHEGPRPLDKFVKKAQ